MKRIAYLLSAISSSLLLAFASNGGTETVKHSTVDYQEASRIINQAYELAIHLRYSTYEKYHRHVENRISRRLDQGLTIRESVQAVKGITPNHRIENLERFLRDAGAEPIIKEKYRQYRNVIEPIFAEYDLDSSIYGYIPWKESRYEEKACTVANVSGKTETVKGMWQICESTAKRFGLTVNSDTCNGSENGKVPDERFDIAKSTRAAARYLREIIDRLGPYGKRPELVLCAYHNGVDAVQRLIQENGDDYWNWEPTEANRRFGFGERSYDYVPWIIATAQLATNRG